jgi:hypothetical protein
LTWGRSHWGGAQWGVFFSIGTDAGLIGACEFHTSIPPFESLKMNAHLKSYLWFVGFLAVTKIVVAPIAKNLNVPLISDIVG